MFNKRKYIAVITIRENELQEVIGFRKLDPTQESFSFRKKSFIVQIDKPTYKKKNKSYYFYNYSDERILGFGKSNPKPINADVIDTILAKNIVNQLTANLNQRWKVELPIIIFSCIFGGLIGFIIRGYV